MGKEKKTVKLGKHQQVTSPIVVGEVKKSAPRMRIVKSKDKNKVTTSNSRSTMDNATTTCETSGNIMRICVNLMPILASTKELVEEEKEEDINCTSEEEQKPTSQYDPSGTKLVQQTLDTSDSCTGLSLDGATETKQSLIHHFVLPHITQSKPMPQYCDHQKTKRFLTPLHPISLSEQTTTISPNSTTKGCGGNAPFTGQVSDIRPWIDNPLFSKSRSAEFRLPDISLSSLDALLQTVTEKLKRKRRGHAEETQRPVQSDHPLMADSEQCQRERRVDLANIEKKPETSVGGHSVNKQRSLPPLYSAPKTTLILTMTKKNLLTSAMLQ